MIADQDDRELVDALLLTSRALVAIAARSLDDLDDDVTLPQFRALVVLATRGALNLTDLAGDVGVHVSTANRLYNRLVDAGLIRRSTSVASGREVVLDLTDTGHELIEQVMRRRQEEIGRIVAGLDQQDRQAVVAGLRAFAEAAGESPQQSWSVGWSL